MPSRIEITNFRQVNNLFKRIDIRRPELIRPIRRVMRTPFAPMVTKSRANLSSQGSIRTGNLSRSLIVRTSFNKRLGYFSVAFGANTRGSSRRATQRQKASANNKGFHFHLVNSGTKRRYHRNFKYVGAVGQGKRIEPNANPSFSVGFADRAIESQLSVIEPTVVSGLAQVYNDVIRRVRT